MGLSTANVTGWDGLGRLLYAAVNTEVTEAGWRLTESGARFFAGGCVRWQSEREVRRFVAGAGSRLRESRRAGTKQGVGRTSLPGGRAEVIICVVGAGGAGARRGGGSRWHNGEWFWRRTGGGGGGTFHGDGSSEFES
jgi:hypothetical protein